MAHFEYPVLTKPSHFNFATDVVDYWASKSPEAQAMHWVSEDLSQIRILPYTYFERQSHRIAVMLKDLGIRPGEVMLMILPRVPAWWEIAVAALRSGIVICSATVLLVEEDIQYRCLETGATAFIGDSASVRKFQNIRLECPAIKHVIQVDENVHRDGNSILNFYLTLNSVPQDARYEGPKTPSEQRALIYFTSGTSGPPKMAQHNHISYPLAHTLTGKKWLHLSPRKLYWNLSEQGWAKSAYSFFSAWNCGASLFIYDDRSAFNPIRLLSILHKFPITTLCAPPTAYRQLVLQKPRDYMKRFPPHSVSHCTSGGEPLNGSVVTTWQEMTGIEICEGYGQTETTLTCGNFGTAPIKPGSMGRPTPGIPLQVISPAGLECEAGVEGDIAIEVGGNDVDDPGYFGLFDGYLKRDGSLDRRISNMGGKSWYLTGDRARRDEDGYFWFVGRADDVINSAGYRIGPFEVESTLKLHPAVIESAVVSSPDFSRGEVVKAFVVLDATSQSNKTNMEEFIKELQDFCKKHAAPYKYPRKIQIVDASFLPKTISGKIKRNELKALEWKEKSRL